MRCRTVTPRLTPGRCRMSRAELEQRLIDLERSIEASKTAIWLAEHEREQLRFELRRMLNKETPTRSPSTWQTFIPRGRCTPSLPSRRHRRGMAGCARFRAGQRLAAAVLRSAVNASLSKRAYRPLCAGSARRA